ncbi:xin actin-binding repeat-containing protein 1-like [Hyla sarda]|uniref:xin actin-binding repeat-containing protein 1-like n=1 Tax=Hyla sarda TaxID=327740 RepID=UPI0024C20F3F|nr:xin actin-binding repeat-containing protein 1-like [Hyla sarda]XP_056375635.1 xin actin-binding repeat-containing protein 1-like [Hyla sarda]
MADNIKKLSQDAITEKKHEADLPLPPPPNIAQPSITVSGGQEQCFMPPPPPPPPPPKESFSKFYEQRQVNELKRLYRHMHPELRKNLEHAVSRDISELLSNDEPNQPASVNLDAVLPGEVQSMRWIFENWKLDTIGEHQANRKLTEEEAVLGGNVKNTSLIFQGQKDDSDERFSSALPGEDQTKGDVKTALWLFETQPLDSLNRIYPEDADVHQAVLKEPVEKGDVKGTKVLFETQSLDEVGRCNSVEEHSLLQLKSEIQELKGDVSKTIKYFQTEPLCAIRDKTGNIHEIKSICREETQSNDINTARWLFETQPLDTINKDTSKVQVIRGISLEEIAKGGVNATKWIFETQPLDTIKENLDEGVFQPSVDAVEGVDVNKQCSIFEKQPVDSINEHTDSKFAATEEILPGDVKSTLWLFETQPMETLKGREVGQLKKVELLKEERGAVQQRKHVFETCSLDKITNREEEATGQYGTGTEEIMKGDVKSFKTLFETLPHESAKNHKGVKVSNQDEIRLGNVKTNQALFESTPLYAIEDSLGNYHEVTSVSREQLISGDVKNYKWMFETKPLDQFNESIQKVDIIKGITKQEILSGDVGTVKWMFETQPVDVINSNKIERDEQATAQKEVLQKGDVNQCRWLFETQPIDQLYDKSENKLEKEPPVQGNVNSHTWMFETQPLDSIGDSKERYIKVSLASPDSLEGVNVKTTKHLFETEPIDKLSSTKEQRKMIRYSSRVEIQSGEVSRVKEIFESKPNVSVPLQKTDIPTEGNIPAGAVNKFTWLFENCPMDSMSVREDGIQELPPEKDIEGGDVGGKKFIFETYALDQIHQDSDDKEICKVQEAVNKGEVKTCTMLFDTKPLYAIQDKGGIYHEVTSVKKEEIQKGDVKGAKWLFETKPLDMIHKDEEVFVIRAVTQEDIEKGCVKSARWRFETEPLDSITDTEKHTARTVDDVQKGDVQINRQLFESQKVNQNKYVRLVSVSDVQKGNVRTSTWLFENQPIDCLKGEDQEHCGIIKVQREDNQKGDVKRCTWLFESQPLDSLKDTESPAAPQTTEDIPKDNVKSTTWLFESTPLDKCNYKSSTGVEQKEISVKDTLDAFLSHNIIQHKGIVIENNNSGNVKMIKYQLSTQTATDIQKEEIVGGNLQRILIQLLHRADVEPHGLLVEENSSGQIIATKLTLLNAVQSTEQEEEHVRHNVAKALKILPNEDASTKTGIIMEESESGSVKIIIYALSLQCKFNMAQGDILKGNVKSTIGNLLASGQENKCRSSVTREQNEKGNVHLFTSCIEKGDLGYLKSLQEESELDALACSQSESMQQETTEQCKQSDNQSKVGPQCVFVASTPIFHPVQPHKSVKECVVDGIVKSTDAQASSCCKIEKRNISLSNTAESNTILQKSIDTKQTSAHQNTSTLDKSFCVVGSTCNASQNNSTTGTDLQAALLDLRQATAEARTIQKQAQCKIKSSSQEIHLTNKEAKRNRTQPVQATLHPEHATVKQTASVMTTATDTKTCYASLQTSTSATKKVSVSEEEKPSRETRAETNIINNNAEPPKCAKNYLNPFSDCDYKAQIEQEERDQDIVRGDVKATIRALQNASKEQKEIEKEEVVKGNLSSTLESLQKSNVNVSKGDFKAAMIYRNAGQSYAACKRNSDVQHIKDQAMAKSMQPSDNNSPPSPAPVTEQEVCQALTSSNVEATKDDSKTVNNPMPNTQDCIAKACRNTVDENTNASQTCQMVQRKKPALPPKPKHLLPGIRPPPRHKNKAFLATSSPVSSPSTPSEECCFKDITEPANMTMKTQSPSNVPNACMYPSTNINSETEKEMLLPHEHKLCNQNNVVTSQDQTYQEEGVIKLDQKTKEAESFECSASIDSNLTAHTMSECHTRQSPEEVINKENLSENLKSEEVSNKSAVHVTQSRTNVSDADNKNVVMRVKRNKESEDARRQRLSIHMDEIMKDNIRTATDIFENLKKQDELEKILEKVTELEEKSSTVDVKSMRGLFETVPDWVVSSKEQAFPLKLEENQKHERFELQREDSESVSSVELAFEDLERASAEIKHLKEQTLAKILDIEETVKKALYAVSNLKSDSDIVSLSGLFRESLGVCSNATNNIRKISIVSSKAKPEKPTQLFEQKCPEAVNNLNNQEKIEHKKTELEVTSSVSSRLSPTSPSFITIESAARKTSQHNSSLPSATISNQTGGMSQGVNGKDQNGINPLERLDPFHQWSVCDNGQSPASLGIPMVHEQNPKSPSSPNSQRQKSVLELKTGPEGPKVIGTTIVTEKYEESDEYGNKIVKSKTSTTVTKQSDTHGSSTFEFVSAPPRYEVTASPILRRHVISSVDHSNNKGNETGVVFVTFGNSKPAKK